MKRPRRILRTTLVEIYNKNIHQNLGRRPFNELDFKERIFEWLEYDSQAGWGILTGRLDNNNLQIKITHLERLYEGAGGQLFGHFLAGYGMTVIRSLLTGYKDCSTAVLLDVKFKGGEMVEIDYELK